MSIFQKDTQSAIEEEKKRRAASNIALNRFKLKAGETATVIFIDGKLDEQGGIDCLSWYEHQIYKEGKGYENYACISSEGPCPVCESGDDASLMSGLTVLNRTGYYSKKEGKQIKNVFQRFVFKAGTYEQLVRYARKQENGLAGLEMEITRTGDKKAAVGDTFVPGKVMNPETIISKMKEVNTKLKDVELPYDYTKIIKPLTYDQLVAKGYGKGGSGGGSSKQPPVSSTPSNDIDDSDIPFD